MASNNSTIDGMGFEEVNQASDTDMISGANVYATSAIEAGADMSVGATLTVGTSLTVGTTIEDSEGQLMSSSIGSGTAVYGANIQGGSGVLAGSSAWIIYPVAYTGIPSTIVSNRSDLDAGLNVANGSLSVGSFCVVGTNATDIFSWTAVGI